MSHHLGDQTKATGVGSQLNPPAYRREDLERYYRASREIESRQHEIDDAREELRELEYTEAVEVFQRQIGLLQKRLINDPRFFNQIFISEGIDAIA